MWMWRNDLGCGEVAQVVGAGGAQLVYWEELLQRGRGVLCVHGISGGEEMIPVY